MTATERLTAPVDAASLRAFRTLFGALGVVLAARYFLHGWIDEYYLEPTTFLPYWGFEWWRPWGGAGMHVHYALLGVAAACVALGVATRPALLAFLVLFAGHMLADKTHYLNHHYLVFLVAAVLALMPWRRDVMPAWCVWALRAQVGLVYFFGGVAKLKPDWLLHAQPLKIWLAANTDFPVIGGFFDRPWVAYAFSWTGALFDLTIVGFLLWRRSRPFAYAAVIAFHLITARLFQLGMFPWLMIAMTTIFFPVDWPRRWLRTGPASPSEQRFPRWPLALLAGHFALQLALPLRHFVYGGNVLWTEEGFDFAWHVMVMEKTASAELRVRDPASGRTWIVQPTEYLTRYQARMASSHPDMLLSLAHLVAEDFRRRGVVDPEVRADVFASLNGRPRARLVDPDVDLARVDPGLAKKRWLLPAPQGDPP
jgi:vitamin K-dependent gamma-carboxylase